MLVEDAHGNMILFSFGNVFVCAWSGKKKNIPLSACRLRKPIRVANAVPTLNSARIRSRPTWHDASDCTVQLETRWCLG